MDRSERRELRQNRRIEIAKGRGLNSSDLQSKVLGFLRLGIPIVEILVNNSAQLAIVKRLLTSILNPNDVQSVDAQTGLITMNSGSTITIGVRDDKTSQENTPTTTVKPSVSESSEGFDPSKLKFADPPVEGSVKKTEGTVVPTVPVKSVGGTQNPSVASTPVGVTTPSDGPKSPIAVGTPSGTSVQNSPKAP